MRRSIRRALGLDDPDPASRRIAGQTRARRLAALQDHGARWAAVRTLEDWERLRDPGIEALRAAIGLHRSERAAPLSRVTGSRIEGGTRVENLVFESRPGLVVTANLYAPAPASGSLGAILLSHGHHAPKTQAELQEMGFTWARQGCLVLVPDQLGHGERRQHPFVPLGDHAGPFPLSRQDYYFRYNLGIQLDLIGDSLIGWMVHDLICGIDLLLSRPETDPRRVVLIGAVAGGGDPAAVAAALDPRISTLICFDFGRAPAGTGNGAEVDFSGPGSWESTRNLRASVRDGFPPWVVLGALAPRRLVYAHEFAWDGERDPVWSRLQRVWKLYGASDRLAAVHGSGSVFGHAPGDTHCTNVGPLHRRRLHPLLERWHGIAPPGPEGAPTLPARELACLPPAAENCRVHLLAAERARGRMREARRELDELAPSDRRERLRRSWSGLLGGAEPEEAARVASCRVDRHGERIRLDVGGGIELPLLLMRPGTTSGRRPGLVVGVAQEGGSRMLRQRAEVVAALLRGGAAVCLADVRGVGDIGRGEELRGRRSPAARLSSSEQMLGGTLLGSRLRDLRCVLRFLRTRREVEGRRVVLWGDSFAPTNPPERELAVPFDGEPFPESCEPLGALLGLFGALYDDDVRAVYAHGGLVGYASLLDSPFLYVPHDACVPGALTTGDLCDVAAALAPRPLRLDGLVDGLNRAADEECVARFFAATSAAYRTAEAADRLTLGSVRGEPREIAAWILARL